MAKPKKSLKSSRGKSLGAALGRAALGSVPGGNIGLALADAALGGRGGSKGSTDKKHPRSRGMHMRKGRLFMGFTQKEVKAAMRRTYGGRRGGKK